AQWLGAFALSLSRRGKKCAFDAEMKPVECKIAQKRLTRGKKITFGGHEGTFFASWNYPQLDGKAPPSADKALWTGL
ncbi:hypothetical protein ACFL6S_31940, partial [Candidatus Poribacteria bacterium]